MRFPPSFLDDIKARVPVSEVVRRRVKLMKSGREWKGLSPFGSEKTPSFFVNDQKMAWFDFSSGKNGNIFDFVMATEGLSFPETVERLAQDAGLPLPARSPENEKHDQKRASLHEVCEWAAGFFEAQLTGERGGKARTYLEGRGISAKSRTEFRIGYAPPDRYTLRDALAAKGATVEMMCEAGLLIHGEEIQVPYDRFRDRLMFPIADRAGRVIAFGGRALEKDVQAKYLNSPETPLFRKGQVLFNHHRARKAAHDKGRVIAVEGYVDVVAMHAAGFPETVAPLGTALTDDQAGLLWAMAPQPTLCFDGDKAGRKAAYRAAEMALPMIDANRTFAFALLPEGQDPDDLIRHAGGRAVEEAIGAALPLVDLIWMRETETHPLSTPEQKAALERGLGAIAGSIRDEALRRHYRAEFGQRLRSLFGTQDRGRDFGGRSSGRRPAAGRSGGRAGRMTMAQERLGYLSAPILASSSLTQSAAFRQGAAVFAPREALILQILLAHPAIVPDFAEDIASLDFTAPDLGQLREKILDFANEASSSSVEQREFLAEAGMAETLARLDRSSARASWYLQPESAPQDAAAVLLQALTLHRKMRALNRELLSAELALATDASETNVARMRDIQEQLSTLAGTEAAVEGFGTLSGRSTTTL